MIDHVPTLTRWAATFRRLAEVDPLRCAGYLGAAQHLEREVASAEGAPTAEAAPDVAPGRVRVDLRTPDRTGR